MVQERNPGPYGGYRFGGVLCYEGTASNEYYRGDIVEIAGKGSEFNFLTEIIPHNGNAVNLVDFADELPPAERAHTRVLADDVLTDGNGRLAEAYETVWVKTYASSVLDTLGFGEYIISDTGARADSVVVDTYAQLTYEPTIGDLVQVEGFMDYAFGAPRVTPDLRRVHHPAGPGAPSRTCRRCCRPAASPRCTRTRSTPAPPSSSW